MYKAGLGSAGVILSAVRVNLCVQVGTYVGARRFKEDSMIFCAMEVSSEGVLVSACGILHD